MAIKQLLSFIIFLFLCINVVAAQKQATLSGYVKDVSTGEMLVGASIFIPKLAKGTTSNLYGFYSITIEEGNYDVEVSFIGYQTQTINLSFTENKKVDIELTADVNELDEVVVSANNKGNAIDVGTSIQQISMTTIKKMPALLGEVDVIKSIQLLPGVSTVGEGASGFNVRGGSIDQNLVLLDEAPVYNSSHLFGFFSVFNPDAVKDVKLYKGGIPGRYGGRLSSILDVRMKDGNKKDFEFNGGIGLIFSRFSVEGPIKKDTASFILAGRRSYGDILARPFLKGDFADATLYFYDLTLKSNYIFNDKNQLFLSGYFGQDVFNFAKTGGFDWGNTTLSLRWNHLFSDKLFSNITAYGSRYAYKFTFAEDDANAFDWDANIINYALQPRISYYLNTDHLLTFGGELKYRIFEPGNAVGSSQGETDVLSLEKKYVLEGALYLDYEHRLANKFKFQYGSRLSMFGYLGKGTKYYYSDCLICYPGTQRKTVDREEQVDWFEPIATYANLEPRLSVEYEWTNTSSIKLGYNRMVQYLHLISNSTASTPVDVWMPSTNNIQPQKVDQLSLGFFKGFEKHSLALSMEVYYKKYQNLVEYIDGAFLFLNPYLEGELIESKGRAYGVEFQLEKKSGQFTGWLSYTYSRTERLAEGISNSAWFPSRFDQPHSLTLTGFYAVNKRLSLSANFIFNSGTPATFPTSRIGQQGYVIPYNPANTRNNVRIPSYHRLDLSATLKAKDRGKRIKSEWVFGVYNVYNRRNPFTIFFRQDQIRHTGDTPVRTDAVRFSVIGSFVPSVSWNFKF